MEHNSYRLLILAERLRISTNERKSTTKSRVEIRNVGWEDVGEYTCRALQIEANMHNAAEHTILLRIQRNFYNNFSLIFVTM